MSTKEHGIIFTAESIRGILAKRKFQTRRVITPANSLIDGHGNGVRTHWKYLDWSRAWPDSGPSPAGNPGPYWHVPCCHVGDAPDLEVVHRIYPRVQTGDSLWARETWAQVIDGDHECTAIDYKAGGRTLHHNVEREFPDMHWNSPLFMPRWASRITLPSITVRTQRVQEISEADAVAEGATRREGITGYQHRCAGWCMDWSRVGQPGFNGRPLRESDICLGSPQMAYASLWNSINAKRGGKPRHRPYSWNANPPVWIYQWDNAEVRQ